MARLLNTLIALTTLALRKETQELLKRIARKGETYHQATKRLYDLAKRQLFYDEHHGVLKAEEFIPLDRVYRTDL